jgi:hypothetical protein
MVVIRRIDMIGCLIQQGQVVRMCGGSLQSCQDVLMIWGVTASPWYVDSPHVLTTS